MHDLKFEELIKFKSRKPERERMFRSAACAKANAAFWENIQMIETVAMVPGYAFMNGEDWGISVVRAMTELNSTDPYEKTVQARASKIWDDARSSLCPSGLCRAFGPRRGKAEGSFGEFDPMGK